MRKAGFLESLVVGLDVAQVPILDSNVEVAEFQVALNSVRCNAFANDLVAGPAQLAEDVLHVFAEVFRDIILTGNTADHLTTVAPGGTPADLVGFHDMHVVTALGQVQRG